MKFWDFKTPLHKGVSRHNVSLFPGLVVCTLPAGGVAQCRVQGCRGCVDLSTSIGAEYQVLLRLALCGRDLRCDFGDLVPIRFLERRRGGPRRGDLVPIRSHHPLGRPLLPGPSLLRQPVPALFATIGYTVPNVATACQKWPGGPAAGLGTRLNTCRSSQWPRQMSPPLQRGATCTRPGCA